MLAILRFTYNKNRQRVVLLETFRKVNWYLTIKSDDDQSFALWDVPPDRSQLIVRKRYVVCERFDLL